VVDSIDVHELMEEFVLLEAVGHCVRTDSCLKQLFMYDATGFFKQCFWLLFSHFEVSTYTPRCQKVGGTKNVSACRMYPRFQKRGDALAWTLVIGYSTVFLFHK